MVLAGLWHGAAWTFVIFGAIHGVVLSAERYLWPSAKKSADPSQPGRAAGFLSVWGQRILTFNVFCLSLAFFRAPSLSAATKFLAGLSDFAWRSEYASGFAMLALFAVPLFVADLLMESSNQEYPFANAPYALRTALATASLFVLALFSGNSLNAFVYFRF
jgi:D-alanyl-lipoteichoic acid acyltransferase DltB (MBOAT superfamily)